MAWIESHQSNRDHPKIIRAARALGISKVTMLGHMHLLWYWALDYAQDGELSAFYAADIAEAAEWAGDPELFIAALVEGAKIGGKPGLLEYLNGALVIHDWYDYAGKLIDRRREDADRKRASRNADVRKTSAGHPTDNSTPSVVPYPTVPYPTQPNPTQQTETEKDARVVVIDPAYGQAIRAFENDISLVSGSLADDMAEMWDLLTANGNPDWWYKAIEVAVGANKRSWRYMRGILTKCLQEGHAPGARTNGSKPSAALPGDVLTTWLSPDGRETIIGYADGREVRREPREQ